MLLKNRALSAIIFDSFIIIIFYFDQIASKNIQTTKPLKNEDLLDLIEKLKFTENEPICMISGDCAKEWMRDYNYVMGKVIERGSILDYAFQTNITTENAKKLEDFSVISNEFVMISKRISYSFLKNSDHWSASLRRMLYLASLDLSFSPGEKKTVTILQNRLESIYAKALVCDNDDNSRPCLALDPDLTLLFKNSRDYDKLLWAWKSWHDVSGKKMRKIFAKTVEILNKAARENGYSDLSESWIEDFQDDNFEKDMDALFADIKPLYDELHTYVRRKLKSFYGEKYPKEHDPLLIPAHILGNIWAQSWENIFDLVIPYPNEPLVNLTKILTEKNYTPLRMFQESENFFKSIGLFKMTPTFWKYSMIEKPSDRSVQCHASAFDFQNGFDYRIKMCTTVNEENFYVIHHEMGHIEYYMSYQNQPNIFKSGANSAFHEAIGDTIALSATTPKHLKKINMIENEEMSYSQNINFLMLMALKKLAFIPFSYLMDKWRWHVFRGSINETNYNQEWWKMRNLYQGLESPIERNEDYFDPGAKYHMASFTPYSRYFISTFLQFQFYKSLCEIADHNEELNKCDIYGSIAAGAKLKEMLTLGSSKHWSYVLEILTKERKVESKAILEYFRPLHQWLIRENLSK